MALYFFLGASDPEMQAIETLLDQVGVPFSPALDATAKRVTPRTAYQAVVGGGPYGVADPTQDKVVLVECDVSDLDACWPVVLIDHHRPGDPGYGKGPVDAVPASALGQVIAVLTEEGIELPGHWKEVPDDAKPQGEGRIRQSGGQWMVLVSGSRWLVIPHHLTMISAADHCLAAAFQGKVPGVHAVALGQWRVLQRAAFQGRTKDEVFDDIDAARTVLRLAPPVLDLDPEGRIKDLRGWNVPELPEAAMRAGMGYLATPAMPPEKTEVKVVLGGCGKNTALGESPIQRFLGGWAAEQGITGLYGDSARGFAGGYK